MFETTMVGYMIAANMKEFSPYSWGKHNFFITIMVT